MEVNHDMYEGTVQLAGLTAFSNEYPIDAMRSISGVVLRKYPRCETCARCRASNETRSTLQPGHLISGCAAKEELENCSPEVFSDAWEGLWETQPKRTAENRTSDRKTTLVKRIRSPSPKVPRNNPWQNKTASPGFGPRGKTPLRRFSGLFFYPHFPERPAKEGNGRHFGAGDY